ncbi:MAG: hypothetical protein F7B59_03785 [Desulfurococcales archaeon]|nr:hypothetical protein [Desulfurococcales archaeon]
MSLTVLLVLAVILGYTVSLRHGESMGIYRLIEAVLSISVLTIVFTVGGRAGFILRSSGSLGFLLYASILFSFTGIMLSLLLGFIVSKWVRRTGEDSF